MSFGLIFKNTIKMLNLILSNIYSTYMTNLIILIIELNFYFC